MDAVDMIIKQDKQNGEWFEETIARQLSFYLSGEIKGAENYTDWFHAIRQASPNDTVILHINSVGGDLATAIQFARVMRDTEAHVVASVEGNCFSAATMIFLCAESYQISEHSSFLFHNYSGMTFGKGGEMYDNIVFERKWSEKLLRGIYADFLTKSEIDAILNGRDVWMGPDEVAERLKKRNEKRKTEEEKEGEEVEKE